MKKSKVTVVILTWNNEKDIKPCLDSVLAINYPKFNVLVVDNNSHDSTRSILRSYSNVELLALKDNYYFTGGNNRGIKYALEKFNPEFILLLNPDTEVEPEILNILIEKISGDEKIGAIGPKIKFVGGENDGRINSAGLFYDGYLNAYDIGFGEEDKGQYDETKEVFGVTGACVLLRRTMLDEIGLFWEKIKMYLDEVELFIRARKSGWKAYYTGETTVLHKHMSSSKQSTTDFESMKKWNWFLIALRHYSIPSKVKILLNYFLYKIKWTPKT